MDVLRPVLESLGQIQANLSLAGAVVVLTAAASALAAAKYAFDLWRARREQHAVRARRVYEPLRKAVAEWLDPDTDFYPPPDEPRLQRMLGGMAHAFRWQRTEEENRVDALSVPENVRARLRGGERLLRQVMQGRGTVHSAAHSAVVEQSHVFFPSLAPGSDSWATVILRVDGHSVYPPLKLDTLWLADESLDVWVRRKAEAAFPGRSGWTLGAHAGAPESLADEKTVREYVGAVLNALDANPTACEVREKVRWLRTEGRWILAWLDAQIAKAN